MTAMVYGKGRRGTLHGIVAAAKAGEMAKEDRWGRSDVFPLWQPKVWFVGEQGTGLEGVNSNAGRRLAAILGMTHDGMVERFFFTNLLSPGSWDLTRARSAATILWRDIMRGRIETLVLLGGRVADAFLGPGSKIAPLTVIRLYQFSILFFPHPSGRNRLWNDPAFKAQASRKLKRFLTEGHPREDGDGD